MRYEELVRDPAGSLATALLHLGLPTAIRPAMLDALRDDAQAGTELGRRQGRRIALTRGERAMIDATPVELGLLPAPDAAWPGTVPERG
jgi:hypothetical protein